MRAESHHAPAAALCDGAAAGADEATGKAQVARPRAGRGGRVRL